MEPIRGTPARRWNWPLLALLVVPLGVGGYLVWRWAQERQWQEIRTAAESGAWSNAETGLRDWVKRHPEDGDAWELLGHILLEQGRDEEGLAVLREVPETAGVWPHTQALVAKLTLAKKDLPEVERVLRKAVERDPRALEAWQQLLPVLVLERRLGEARRVLRKLYELSRDPRPLADSLLLGQIESEVRDQNQDLEAYLRVTPDDPWLRRAWGMQLHGRGQSAEALPYLEEAARRFGDDPLVRFAWAECQMALGKSDQDIEILGEPPDRRWDAARWWVLRSRLEETWGRGKESRASLEKAVELDPKNFEAQYRLGQVLVREGEAEAGQARLERADAIAAAQESLKQEARALLRGGHDAASLLRIGRLCEELGLPEARDWLELSIRSDPRQDALRFEVAKLPAGGGEGAGVALSDPRLVEGTGGEGRSETSGRGFVDVARGTTAARFEEIADRAGVNYRYEAGETPDLFIGDTMGGGVGLIDYDGDGWLDIYFVNGCALPVDRERTPTPNRLYRNRRDGTFEDVTEAAGVAGRGYGMGCAVADYDGDGDEDLLVTGLSGTILYRNRGDGTFEDVTEAAGVGSSRWTTAAGFGDLDGDADLDLMVVTYVDADPKNFVECRDRSGRLIHCQPLKFEAQLDQLFRNNGDGTFTDVSAEAGIERPEGRGLGLAILDYDEDGRLDLFVANDGSANFLFRNLGDWKFEDVAMSAGAAYDASGQPTASMGVVAQDLNGDGRIDLMHTNFLNQSSTLRLNAGGGLFVDGTLAANLAVPSRAKTGWGIVPLDVENDGTLDLFVANGHVDDQPWFNTPMAQEPQLYLGRAEGRFELAGGDVSGYFTRAAVGRGVAAGDLDNDGRIDVVVVHRDRAAAILRNVSEGGHWLGLRLRGVESGALPVGAKVTCRVGDRMMTRWVTSGTGYLSSSDPRVWFGLGEAALIDAMEVRWPSGRVQGFEKLAGDRILELTEGGELETRKE